jgi:hypothetical protein
MVKAVRAQCQAFFRRAQSAAWETVEILEWVALLWILALAKARSGPSRTGIADIRSDLGQASNAGQRQNQRNP